MALAFAYFFEFSDLNTFALAAPSLVRQWGLSVNAVAAITSASFGGMFVGAAAGGWIADRLGRKTTFVASVLVYTTASLLNALAWDVGSAAVLRLVTGVGLSSMVVTANTYVSELFPARSRGRWMAAIATFGLVGIPATAWIARLLTPLAPWGWRLIFVWGGLGLAALVFTRGMPESPRWRSNRGQWREAEAIVASLEAEARRGDAALPEPEARPDPPPQPRAPYMELFRQGQARRTLFLLALWAVQTVGFYGFVSWVPTLLAKHGFSVVHSLTFTSVMAICNPLGALLSYAVVDHVERKWFIAIGALAIAAIGIAYGFSAQPVFIMLFGALMVMGLQTSAVALYTYTPELFPTGIRSSGMGLCYGAGRLMNVVSPFIIGAIFQGSGYVSVFLFIAVCWLLVATLTALFGPPTARRSLEALGDSGQGDLGQAEQVANLHAAPAEPPA